MTDDGTTVRGSLAPSVQPARTPGVLTMRYVAVFAVNEGAEQATPAVSTMFDAFKLTVVHKAALFAAAPLAQYPKESVAAVDPELGTYVNVPFAFRVTTP